MSSKFLMIFRGAQPDPHMSPEQMQDYMARWGKWMGGLGSGGNLQGGQPLHPTGRVLSGPQKTLTDRPFAEAKDLVGGYVLVTAESLDQATELARDCPVLADGGTVEIRETRSV